jgi:phospholipid/cholesterol/gamma-HCH transport system substrate-binding protein
VRRTGTTRRLPNWALGLAVVVLVVLGLVLAFRKELPWTDRFEVHAVFSSPQTLRTNSPVRIAGVNVGEVTAIELVEEPVEDDLGNAQPGVRVTMELDESALPLSEDASFRTRPRLFIDGNYFVDVQPGSPSAPKIEEGHTFGLDRTSRSVQLDEVLTTLQSNVRGNTQLLLDQLGNALIFYRGAEGLRELYRTSPPAYRFSAQVAESQLGTHPGDLRGFIRGLGRVLRGLGRNQQALSDLVTNLRGVTGAFAAEDEALGRAVELLPEFLAEGEPTFRELNEALPYLRAFAREALPGIRKSPEALRAGVPFLRQLRALMSRSELRGAVARLRPTVPALVRLARANAGLFTQQRAFSSCFNEVIIPWSHSTVEPPDSYPLEVGGRNFETALYGITGTASESRNGDAAGQHLRVLAGSGANLVRYPAAAGRDEIAALTPFPVLGTIPRLSDSAKTRFRPGRPCERQEPPNLEAGIGSPPSQQPVPRADLDDLRGPGAEGLRWLLAQFDDLAGIAALPPIREAEEIARAQLLVDVLGLQEIDVERLVEGSR